MNARNSLAMAVLLATASFSSVVAASEVKMYGQIDNAIAYTKAEGENGKVTMDPSVDIPSKWGIMGREDLGNGNYVRFNLEQGFAPDAGTMTWSDRIFGREALVMIGGNWGELALGRTGTFFGSIGTYGQWAKMGINPMQTNYSDATLGGVFTATGMASNSITYQVKPIDTLTLTAQYVNGDHEDYEWSQDDHLYQLAAFYKNADLSVGLRSMATRHRTRLRPMTRSHLTMSCCRRARMSGVSAFTPLISTSGIPALSVAPPVNSLRHSSGRLAQARVTKGLRPMPS